MQCVTIKSGSQTGMQEARSLQDALRTVMLDTLHHAQRHESPRTKLYSAKTSVPGYSCLVGAIISSSSPFLNGRP